MGRKRKLRLFSLLGGVSLISMAIALVLYSLTENINLFFTPTELRAAHIGPHQTIRLGGYVKKGSLRYSASGAEVSFLVTDRKHNLEVRFNGVLPNLFREGQTVVVTGQLVDKHFIHATEVLAKHDEKYMPRPLALKLGAI